MITKKTSYIKILIKQTCALLIDVITCNVYVLFIHTLGEIKQPPVPVLSEGGGPNIARRPPQQQRDKKHLWFLLVTKSRSCYGCGWLAAS